MMWSYETLGLASSLKRAVEWIFTLLHGASQSEFCFHLARGCLLPLPLKATPFFLLTPESSHPLLWLKLPFQWSER